MDRLVGILNTEAVDYLLESDGIDSTRAVVN